jgi:protein gp37
MPKVELPIIDRKYGAVTLGEWKQLTPEEQDELLHRGGGATFLRQESSNIEWALWSWNPVTGCLHNCPYCYARDIANDVYDQGFEPAIYPGRLVAPRNTPFPLDEVRAQGENSWKRIALGNVFVCSMADLFGRWVPTEWVERVLEVVRSTPQWTYLFLTKFPVRMAEFDFPPNTWVGTTVDMQARVANAERAFRKVKCGVKWLSCEPMIEPLHFTDLGAFDWIVIGGASKSTHTPEWHPPLDWVAVLEVDALKNGVPFYEKSNLYPHLKRVRMYPGQLPQARYKGSVRQRVEVPPGELPYVELTRAPKGLRYLPEVEQSG